MTSFTSSEQNKPINVLVVDDEPLLIDIAQRFLELNYFSTDSASSADEALEKIQKNSFDVIVSDYQMPGKDGIELLREVRSGNNSLPFILFTGKGREDVVIRALNEGADFYLQKGGDAKAQFVELSHMIRRAVERRNAVIAIEERNEVLGAILAASPCGIALVKNRVIQWLNEPLAQMFGYTTDDLIKMPVRNLYETDEDYLRTGERIFADLRVNGMSKLQTRLKRKNGSLVDCEVQMAALNTKNPLYSRMVTFREIHV